MKTKFTVLVLILALMGFSEKSSEQEYSYLLTITSISMNNEDSRFNLEITSKYDSSEPVRISLKNQTTPFELKLKPGEHSIVVAHIGEKGFINSQVVGILNGKKMGSASTDDSGTVLRAGPGGRYSAGR